MIFIYVLWIAGGLLLHFLPGTAPEWSSWAVFGGLVFLSGIILFARQKTAAKNNEEENGASEDSSPPPPPSPSSSNSNWWGMATTTVVLAAIAGGLLWWSPWKDTLSNSVKSQKTEESLSWTQGDVPGVIRLVTPRDIKAGDSILLLNTHWMELYAGSKKIKTCSKKTGCKKIKFLSIKAGTFSFRPKEKTLPPMIKVAKILRH